MKKLLLAFYIILVGAQSFGQGKSISKAVVHNQPRYLPNRIIVKLKPTSSSNAKSLSAGQVLKLSSIAIDKFEQKFPTGKAKTNATILKKQEEFGLNRIYELVYSGNKDVGEIIQEIKKNSNVEYAEPVYVHHADYTSTDTYYNLQTYLEQVKAPLAWNLIRNEQKVIIAIVDSGSDTNHEDLSGNIYFNNNDPINGKDDDGDGYVDNYRGWDFVGSSGNNITEDNNPNITQSGGDHGLHVSGIASSVTDNAKGVSSIAFNCAKLMIIKTASDDNGTDILRGYEGIKYAVDHGAQIINCSWGSESASYYGQDIVNYAISKGCLIVAAAGNSGSDVPQYPAGFPGVIAVANVQANDMRNGSSNFGSYVSISAPGTSIYSTTLNSYGYKSGTSMATPVVASAAALVKAYFPNLTMQQVGEQLRATSDNIDGLNPAYANKLGKGRLNVYRALTESQPAIKKENTTYVDKSNGTFPAGDTVTIYASFKNFLNPVSNLRITLKSDDKNVIITESQATISSLGTLATSSDIGPFKFYIKPGTPENYTVSLSFEYTANNNSYTDFEGFAIKVNRDYLNLATSTISTTITSEGTIGFMQAGGEEGTNGFQYKGEQLLYEAGLIIGNSSTRVSNNVRSSDSSTDYDFIRQVKVNGTTVADTVKATAEFNDSANSNKLNVYVKQRSYVVNNNTADNYMITEYEVINQNNSELTNVYIGVFNDWDINGGSTNTTEFDTDNKIAYVYDKSSSGTPYAAVKLLSSASPAYYPLSNRLSGNLLVNDNFSDEEKFTTLSSGIAGTGLGISGSGTDVSFVTGYGPYTIPANGSVKAAFAYIGAGNLNHVRETANIALSNYRIITPPPEPDILELKMFTYYSSSDHLPYVAVSLPENTTISLDLYNLFGKKVSNVKSGAFIKGNYIFQVSDAESLASGTYFYQLHASGQVRTLKTVIVH